MTQFRPTILIFAGVLLALLAAGPARCQSAAASSETLTLQQAVTLALQNSRDVKLAQVQYNVALGEVGVDRAAFRPNLYTGSGAAYTHGFPSLPGGNAPAVFQMDYTQTLFNPLLKGEQHAAEDRAKNQRLQLDRTRDDVIVRAATAYLDLAKVRHSLDLMRSEQASGAKILEAIRERLAADQELPIEVTRSQLALARVQERVVKLENREGELDAQLRDLAGIPDSQSIRVETDEPAFSAELAADVAAVRAESEMVDLAMKNDRSIEEADNERMAREQLLRGAKLSYWPTVDLVGEYSILSKFNNYGEFYKKFERNNVNIGVQVTIPLFAAKTSANVALAKSQLTAAELTLGNKRQEVRLDVLLKARSVREVDASLEVARLDLQLAQETLQLAQARFDQGRVTLQEIEQAHVDENDKWMAFLDADFARQHAQLTLLQATGQLAKVFH
jgi:outer membrane protein TolC